MGTNATRIRIRNWKRGALQAAAIAALTAGCGVSGADGAKAPAPSGNVAAQAKSDDPCRYFTAEEMGKAFGQPMKSSKLVNVCQYRGTGTSMVYVKVATGTEGTILRYAKMAPGPGQKGSEKVPTRVGEAYFDAGLPVFIGRVGNQEVQIETTIEPVPRDAMVAVGTRILETLSRQ